MDHYMDLRILKDPEFPTTQLVNALFSKLHRGLVRLGANDIGVSFPNVDEKAPHLGDVLRLHGTEDAFSKLLGDAWLVGMRDHVRIGSVTQVPPVVEHRHVQRVQVKSNVERIRRRQMKRHGWSAAEAREKIPESAARILELPYVRVESQSSGHRFHLFLRHQPVAGSTVGTFNAYGLSATATVPWF
jgi:CRISPR-associated endonuclease Csy4